MSNTVTLTIAGNPQPAVDAFKRVGQSSEDMSKKVHQSGEAFDRAGERADNVDTKAMGFRDTLTGIQDGTEGVKRAAQGDWGFETLLLLGFGIGDLASGMTNLLVPAVKKISLAMKGLNLTFLASPITWIILGIVALVAVFVLLWMKCDWFRNFWKGLWKNIKEAASAVGSWFKDMLWPWIRNTWQNILDKGRSVWNWLKALPGNIKGAFKNLASFISAPFKAAFNYISDAWNRTIGGLSWTLPGWIPGIGGGTFSVPRLPKFHSGGTVPGAPGSEMLAILQAGEKVIPAGGGGGSKITIHSGGTLLDDALVEILGRAIRVRGGNVQLVLGHG